MEKKLGKEKQGVLSMLITKSNSSLTTKKLSVALKPSFKMLLFAIAALLGSLFEFSSRPLLAHSSSTPYIQELLYSSIEELEKAYADIEQEIKKKIDLFISYSQEKQFEKAYQEWNDLGASLFTFNLQTTWILSSSSHPDIKEATKTKNKLLLQYVEKEFTTRNSLIQAFIANGLAASSLTADHRYATRKILTDYLEVEKQSPPSIKEIQLALQHLQKYPESNFSFLEKRSSQNPVSASSHQLSLFSANILCFPKNLTYFYGGVSPWKDRISKLVEKCKETKADILCLQEVWDPKAMQALIDYLQDDYRFFVFDAGNQFATIHLEEMGYSSGLFIASKIPFEEIAFTPFAHVFPAKGGVKRGALLIKCTVQDQQISCVNTHIQHGNDAQAVCIRQEQLLTCHKILEDAIGKHISSSWGCLLGDLNINAFSQEFVDSGISELFTIPYLHHENGITPANATATEYFSDLFFTPVDKRAQILPSYELLDYCLCPIRHKKHFISQKVPLFSISDPEHALSDHQGLLTIWRLKVGSSF